MWYCLLVFIIGIYFLKVKWNFRSVLDEGCGIISFSYFVLDIWCVFEDCVCFKEDYLEEFFLRLG